jgi:hypothetical protein
MGVKAKPGTRRTLVVVTAAVLCVIAASIVADTASQAQRPPSVTRPAGGWNLPYVGCAFEPLATTIAYAKSVGAPIIVARGRLSGRVTSMSPSTGEVFHEMLLRSVQTLSGPAVADGTSAWIPGGGLVSDPVESVPAFEGSEGSLWGADGRLFAIMWPKELINRPVGPLLRMAPVVRNEMIFSDADCWNARGLPGRYFDGPLTEVPGSGTLDRVRSSKMGLVAVPLSVIEMIVAG